ncbi:MAG TPA: hypothetical protein VJN64_06850 [Terriglobales bacterium]|nr:hypothetical protein [Terriglobales bacterium]
MFALCALVLAIALRYVPLINDALSGPPQSMRALAHEFARDLVEAGHGAQPLFVARDEAQQCRKLPLTSNFNEDAIAIIIYYAESTHSLCTVTYAGRVSKEQDSIATLLDPRTMESYGAGQLDGPVKGVPVSYFLKAFPPQLLALLDWHRSWPSGDGTLGVPKLEENRSAVRGSSEGLTMDLKRVRAEVGERHRKVNTLLNGAILLLFVTVVASGGLSLQLYRELRAYRIACGLPLTLPMFFLRPAHNLAAEAAALYREMDQARSVAEKALQARQRRLADARSRLEFLLEREAGQEHRSQIQACLETADPDQMEELADQLLNLPGQRTPEDRLKELLQSLNDLCALEEYEEHRKRAFELLNQGSFRIARDFLVRTHTQLRERARAAEREISQNEKIIN